MSSDPCVPPRAELVGATGRGGAQLFSCAPEPSVWWTFMVLKGRDLPAVILPVLYLRTGSEAIFCSTRQGEGEHIGNSDLWEIRVQLWEGRSSRNTLSIRGCVGVERVVRVVFFTALTAAAACGNIGRMLLTETAECHTVGKDPTLEPPGRSSVQNPLFCAVEALRQSLNQRKSLSE